MSEVIEYSLVKHDDKKQKESQGLSRVDKMKAAVYGVATEINQIESPYEDALSMKAGDALMVIAERGVKRVHEKIKNGRNRMQQPPKRLKDTATKPLLKSDFTLA